MTREVVVQKTLISQIEKENVVDADFEDVKEDKEKVPKI